MAPERPRRRPSATPPAGQPERELQAVYRQAERHLSVLYAAETLEALLMLPSNRCKALGDDRQGQYSIRINDQWRICF